ncbi:hypothetical protein K438DRAFT_1925160 [Mycena galopus ATCC 62051]|nr:hypothetical protein K438DRAFT_1925160 [Mycena galopus ATCC 62051]
MEALVEQIDTLIRKLPSNVPIAARESHISSSLTLPGEDGKAASSFNRRTDVLFGEDVRDATGRLKYVAAGKYGMHAVVKYLKTVPWAELECTIFQPKLDRIIPQTRLLPQSPSRSASLPSPLATRRIFQKLSAFEAVPDKDDLDFQPEAGDDPISVHDSSGDESDATQDKSQSQSEQEMLSTDFRLCIYWCDVGCWFALDQRFYVQ